MNFFWEKGVDVFLIQFGQRNIITLTLIAAILIGITKVTPWAWDTKIVKAFFDPILNLFRDKADKK